MFMWLYFYYNTLLKFKFIHYVYIVFFMEEEIYFYIFKIMIFNNVTFTLHKNYYEVLRILF